MTKEKQDLTKQKLGISKEGGQGRYLGLPEDFGGPKVTMMKYLKDNMAQKIKGWQNGFLSPGGKEVMLKAVAFALPTYTMACFLVPKTICKQIASLMADFWWKSQKDRKGMHWKAWEQLSIPKSKGGLGFRDIEAFNLALLGKQLWRLTTREDTLLTKVFKARYFKKESPLEVKLGSRPSYAWKSIHAAQKLLQMGVRRVIGNGEKANIWRDPWIDNKPARPIRAVPWIPNQVREALPRIEKVKDLLAPGGKEWRDDILDTLFSEEDRDRIHRLRPGRTHSQDGYCWDYSKSGQYMVKSGYWVQTDVLKDREAPQMMDQPSLDELYRLAWKSEASPKVHHFLWRCLSNSLAVTDNLKKRHILKDSQCIRCQDGEEDINHLLFKCPFARLVWAVANFPAPPNGEMEDSHYSNLHRVMTVAKQHPQAAESECLGPWILWRLWKNRNELSIKGVEFDAVETVQKAKEDMLEWQGRMRGDNTVEKQQPIPNANTTNRWKPPPRGWVKCNVDGSWSQNRNHCGIGWVLRNEIGNVLWSGARKLHMLGSVLETEVEALRWSIQMVTSLNYEHIIFETDSKQVIDIVSNVNEWPNFRALSQDIQFMLRHTSPYHVVFQPRDCNGVADRMAKETFSFLNLVPKVYSIMPDWLSAFVQADKQVCNNDLV